MNANQQLHDEYERRNHAPSYTSESIKGDQPCQKSKRAIRNKVEDGWGVGSNWQSHWS
ncbi:hypothetical protein HanIR_Chr08g0367481 [Helianthus annuus]|nr:hypothetical protein HanIR_Chr08g0367481 [Helianthus annuus]